ncbi:MAG: 2-hydroxyacid dehydrogenase [Candidatus Omnitrophica bacterium]|nr:2-hydroxyacid dehydrogenase [Candidatus Omnitrophota bacterium]
MKIAFFSTKQYDREFFDRVNKDFGYEIVFFESRLKDRTAPLTKGFDAVCVFVNDEINAEVLKALNEAGVKLLLLRSAGFNNVDLCAAYYNKIRIARVPAYSPNSVAEHAAALMMSLNRKIVRAYNRVRDGNFSLEGLVGFEVHDKKIGIVGTGKIGVCFAKIMLGFGAEVLAYDPFVNPELERLGVKYLPLEEVFKMSDVISLHVPLIPETQHLINEGSIKGMKKGVMILNTSRGALIDTSAVINALKSGQIGSLALDVYEEEANIFFKDLSGQVLQDDIFARLLTFPNVLITGHQGFFTDTALLHIAQTTLSNMRDFEHGALKPGNEVTCDRLKLKTDCGRPCGRADKQVNP